MMMTAQAAPLVAAAHELQACHNTRLRAPKAVPVWSRLQNLPDWLSQLRRQCIRAEPEAAKAAEWLLDNHYHVDRAIRQVRQDMPRKFYARLPGLKGSDFEGLPRIFCVAHGLLEASHLQLSLAATVEFANAYQSENPLSIAELWAFPTMLRLACLEILAQSAEPLFPALKAPFAQSAASKAADSIEPTEGFARALASLQIISTIPWKEFFDQTSHVEATLRKDPPDVYGRMDFDTRDRYRKIVEEIAYRTNAPEVSIAERALANARLAHDNVRQNHIGYWLAGDGRPETERQTGYHAPLSIGLRRFFFHHAGQLFAAALILLTVAAVIPPVLYALSHGASAAMLIPVSALALTPATIISITIINWLISLTAPPRVLSKLDFKEGIPAQYRTAVVMPVIVKSVREAERHVEHLEMQWLTNQDRNLRYVLLSDHADASAETTPLDKDVEKRLVDHIRTINSKYASDGAGPFHLWHRPRRFNPSEGCWMAWERKRGKLEEFNKFVLTGDKTGFSLEQGDTDKLRDVKFVVTIDADTVLPIGAVSRLVGTLAHPLNRPEVDPATGRICAGYSIIQPRIEITPEIGSPSLFFKYFAGDTAIDIYSCAVSDTYQDLFGSAVYVGKGIYDVAAFDASLQDRVPDNALLSHDLFEGAHARAALASDIVVYDGFPGTYLEYVNRLRRWIRGDWQLLPWLRRLVPGKNRRHTQSRLTTLDRWKIFDNLRRSLIPFFAVSLAIAGWTVFPGSPLVWTLLAILAPGAYLFTDLATGLSRWRRRNAFESSLHKLANHACRWAFAIAFLLYEALISAHAVTQTLWRLFVSRRKRLEWTSAAHTAAEFGDKKGRLKVWRDMWAAPVVSLTLAGIVAFFNPIALPAATPLLFVWFVSPEIAVFISRSGARRREVLCDRERAFLRRVARRTWYFFETFVGPEDNWLPPDNFQADPHAKIAHRTSPTNIGMLFVSSLTARDLGYLGTADLAIRIENGLNSMTRLRRYRGHILNWYDTRTLSPLEPMYVSTVDSGNLAASLITLKEGCLEAIGKPAVLPNQWQGLLDTFEMLAEALGPLSESRHNGSVGEKLELLRSRIAAAYRDSNVWRITLNDIIDIDWPVLEEQIAAALAPPNAPSADRLHKVTVWIERFNHDLSRLSWDLDSLLPWLSMKTSAPDGGVEVTHKVLSVFPTSTSLAQAEEGGARAVAVLEECAAAAEKHDIVQWLADFIDCVKVGVSNQVDLRERLRKNAALAETFAFEMDFRLLYDWEQNLFHIGHNVSSDKIDPHHYDLLATEARVASYFAIAKGDVPPEHWRHLGRPVTRADGELSLLSWNGSMFEYLMPALWLKNGPETLLDQAEKTAVDVQRRYAEKLNIPWGVSESGFASRDAAHHYQYRAFGAPGLGLRRGLVDDIVIAPYAAALALAAYPATATRNMQALCKLGLLKTYGFIEAADFTPERAAGRAFIPVNAFMAHHQGMLLAAIGNALNEDVLAVRFLSNLQMRATSLLLQERTPWELPSEPILEEEPLALSSAPDALPDLASWTPAQGDLQQVHLLGNGRFATWISETGGGVSWWGKHALTRWRGDTTCDNDGLWVYLRDAESGDMWSAGRQPMRVAAEDRRVTFHPHMAEFHRRDHGIATRMDVSVAPGDDLEFRIVTITNETDRPRTLEITSYAETALTPPRDDERHPAFSKMFVGGEYVSDLHGLLFKRRAHRPNEQPPTLLHRMIFDDSGASQKSFEADRRAFLGRGGSLKTPRGIADGLTETTGWTLDPVMVLQARLELAPLEQRQCAFITIAGGSPETVFDTAERYATLASLEWTLDDAKREAAREAHDIDINQQQIFLAQALASCIADPPSGLRAETAVRRANKFGQPRLWTLGVSGDVPILLAHIDDTNENDLLKSLIRIHALWRRRSFHVDLILLRTGVSGYVEPVRERVLSLIRDVGAHDILGRRGGIHIFFADQLTPEDQRFLESAARIIIDEKRGALSQQIADANRPRPQPPLFEPTGAPLQQASTLPPLPTLSFANSQGGFANGGQEYLISLEQGEHTPAPWSNVLANEGFGCLSTEAGLGFTWAVNSGENRITHWSNDPVCDPPSEALYLRNEQTGDVWSITPLPAGREDACRVRHGAGYTTWMKYSHELEQEQTVFVAPHDPVKLIRLRLRNLEGTARRITATFYAEWELGPMRATHRPHIVCEYDAKQHALLARNSWSPEFGSQVAFLTSSHKPHSLTTDRRDFLGREGDLAYPAGLRRWDLGERVEAEADPCAAYQVHLDIGAGETAEVVFILGQGCDRQDAERLIEKWRTREHAKTGFEIVKQSCRETLSVIKVETPDPAFDIMMNNWLVYQSLSSRILARAGFYQAGGAIGFRDQLQDVLALLHADPARARAHILDCARRQFEEGDVLHWWHPPMGRGVRTRCSDDLLWLPYATCHYVQATGDVAILEEKAPFLQAPRLSPEEEDRYAFFEPGPEKYSLFDHCERALERGVTKGPQGLPLIGAGDWNDGMNRVGARGRGESVWLAWFAIATMTSFAEIAASRGRRDLSEKWKTRAADLRKTIDDVAWDGEWYVRAYDDDGHPWGSRKSEECRIDSIAQSWAVLSGEPSGDRARTAVQSAVRELVDEKNRLVKLFWPPIHETPRDPGYIKAYPPGVRENGGQYTHAAAWLGLALAKLGDGDGAHRIFDIINPIRRTLSKEDAARYLTEPYVLAADVAGEPPHVGRGGWSWYTGAAAWTYRLGLEGILGLSLKNGALEINPHLPKSWKSARAKIHGPKGVLDIEIDNSRYVGRGAVSIDVDGVPAKNSIVPFPADGSVRHVFVTIKPDEKTHHAQPAQAQ